MNREIKFRAWDKKRQVMIGCDYPSNFGDEKEEYWGDEYEILITSITDLNNKERFEVMQYTGLKDVNGKEIYEWDFVKSVSLYPKGGQSETVYEVVFEEDELRFALSSQSAIGDDKRTESFGWWIGNDWNKLEVIGNVYENPELLK